AVADDADLESQHLAVGGVGRLGLDDQVAVLARAYQVFLSVWDPLDRAALLEREAGDGQLLRIHGQLDAEPAAGVGRGYADLRRRHIQDLGDDRAREVDVLEVALDGERLEAGVVLGDDPAGLQRGAGVAGGGEAALDHAVGALEGTGQVAAL